MLEFYEKCTVEDIEGPEAKATQLSLAMAVLCMLFYHNDRQQAFKILGAVENSSLDIAISYKFLDR